MLLKNFKSKVFDSLPSLLNNAPQFSKPLLNKIGDYTPVVGTTFGIIKTAKKVYNCTSPVEAVTTGVKSVLIDCTSPVVKYPVLCGAMAVCAVATLYSGNPNFACGAIKCAEIMIEDVSGG